MKIFDTASPDTIVVELTKKTKLTLRQGKVSEDVTLNKGRHTVPLNKFKPGPITITIQGTKKIKEKSFAYTKAAKFTPELTLVTKGRVSQFTVNIPHEAKVNLLGYNAVMTDSDGKRLSRYSSPANTIPYLVPMTLPDGFKGIVNVEFTTRTRTGSVRSTHQLTV